MNHAEKLAWLTEWQKSSIRLKDAICSLIAIVGIAETPFYDAIFASQEQHAKAVAALVGDSVEWLDWYAHQCDYGRKPKAAGVRGDMREIATVEDLLWLIELDVPEATE